MTNIVSQCLTRWPPPVARRMKVKNLRAELKALGNHFTEFRKTAEGGGSPGEWMVERMDEIETELKRRGIQS